MEHRIIYILKHNPWGRGGGAVASRLYLKAMSNIFCNSSIDVLLADTCLADIPADVPHNLNFISVNERSFISKVLSPLSGIMHRYQDLAKVLVTKYKYEWCVFDHSSIGGTLIKYMVKNGVKVIQLHHNHEPKYYKDSSTSLIDKLIFLPIVKKNERYSYKNSTINLFLTDADKNIFERKYGSYGNINTTTGVYIENYNRDVSFTTNYEKKIKIAITGALNSAQNVDAIKEFILKYYDALTSKVDAKIIIAGNKPPIEIKQICSRKSNISLIDSPLDIDEAIKDCNIFLCPCRLGSGIKIRVLDGFRNGMLIIAHNVSASGYEEAMKKGYLLPYTTPEEFVNGVQLFEKKVTESVNIKAQVISFAKETYSLNNIVKKIEYAISKV